MARGIEGNEVATPKSSTIKKTTSTQKKDTNQRTLLGFFQKQSLSTAKQTPKHAAGAGLASRSALAVSSPLTPAPSSDALSPPHSSPTVVGGGRNKENGLLSPPTSQSQGDTADGVVEGIEAVALNSPTRKARKQVNYAESEDEEDEQPLRQLSANRLGPRATKRRRIALEDSEDEFNLHADEESALAEVDLDDFIVPDDSEEEVVRTTKRKRPSPTQSREQRPPSSSPPKPAGKSESEDDFVLPTTSTAQQWTFDPTNTEPAKPRAQSTPKPQGDGKKRKEKAHTREPEERYTWLAKVLDIDRNPIGHPDYDPRTIYVPPLAWAKFSPFEKQYWEIKQKLWDTIVFFKKGKFYELYENDATIGHQLFDLKLTDRVNMRMVGVPEASLDHWANQFVAKGFKIARVDQMETALGKEMRERDDNKKKKEEKVIRRELASVLTSGTLVDAGMLHDDMATFCVAIKEVDRDNVPCFGIAFVDTATAQFWLAEWEDDVDLTKFETFVAQTRPGELLLEKSCLSTKALRILKNNTGPTTIWNYLKPTKEFWPADITSREIDASDYFVDREGQEDRAWPLVLEEAKAKDLAMSAFGALLQYLRMLKIEKDLVSLGNFAWYDPIKKATSLVLDGQTLINLEIFANTFDGGPDGTLFALINRCITPFGKRLLRQWVCHPLADSRRINARLDAVESLMADRSVMDSFSGSLSKMPDLERLISRVHAGRCKAQEFVRVLDGFEQIEYTMGLLNTFPKGDGVVGQLIASMPDLSEKVRQWKNAFDRKIATEDGILVPEPGVETDFDESQDTINACLGELERYLKEQRTKLGSSSICYRDNGKEIYQLELPIKVKNVPKSWDQMSATKTVKRYYSSELRKLVRCLQEAQETHAQIVKEVAGRFYSRFDEDYKTWLSAVNIIAQLDGLISLAKASQNFGAPSCRPMFVDEGRTIVDFEELRHPCMLATVDNFIPNDIKLGGTQPNIDLLTGANAAGKSTVLRMTCTAVILAQIGCYVPASSARLTPIDRIMSRLGAFDNIFAAQSTFFVELSETKKVLSEATERSLVILDELGRGTSSYDGVAVAQAVLHDVSTRIGCVGFFATHYHSLAAEFGSHPEIRTVRMAIDVCPNDRTITFLYRLEDGVAEGSFGMHCAAMCGIPSAVIERAEIAAREWEHTSRLKESLDKKKEACYVPLGLQSDVAWMLKIDGEAYIQNRSLEVLRKAVEAL